MGYYNLPAAKYSEGPLGDFDKALRNLPPPQCMQTLGLIETTTRNVAQNPKDSKFRKLRLANEKIAQSLTNVEGAYEIMSQLGWEIAIEGSEAFLVLPESVQLTFPEHVHKILETKPWYVKENDKRRIQAGLSRVQTGTETKFLPREGDENRVPGSTSTKTPLQVAVETAAAQA